MNLDLAAKLIYVELLASLYGEDETPIPWDGLPESTQQRFRRAAYMVRDQLVGEAVR